MSKIDRLPPLASQERITFETEWERTDRLVRVLRWFGTFVGIGALLAIVWWYALFPALVEAVAAVVFLLMNMGVL